MFVLVSCACACACVLCLCLCVVLVCCVCACASALLRFCASALLRLCAPALLRFCASAPLLPCACAWVGLAVTCASAMSFPSTCVFAFAFAGVGVSRLSFFSARSWRGLCLFTRLCLMHCAQAHSGYCVPSGIGVSHCSFVFVFCLWCLHGVLVETGGGATLCFAVAFAFAFVSTLPLPSPCPLT